MPVWFLPALATALAVSSQEAGVKRFFSDLNVYEMAAYPLAYSFPLFVAAALLVPVPPLDATFAVCFVASIPLNGVAFVLYTRAIQISPLSLTVPYLAFTPAFMIVTGAVFLGEVPSAGGLAGILTLCAGGYILNIDPARWSLFDPLKAVFRETGSWVMLVVSGLFSITAVIGKKGMLHSTPLFFIVVFFGSFALIYLIYLRLVRGIRLRRLLARPGRGLIVGGLFFLHAVLHGWAISLTQASYMISVKRLSVVFGVIYGKLIFQETNIAFRISGAALMALGTALITLTG